MAVITKAERRLARDEALANTRIEGHVPTPEFLADFDSVVDGRMTPEQAIEASMARATGRGILKAARPAGTIVGFVGLLAGRTKKVAAIEEMNGAAAAGMNTGEDGQ